MSFFTFLALVLVGYLVIMAVLSSILWCAVRLWQWRTGRAIDVDAGLHHRHQQVGKDRAAEHAAQALRSHPGPPPFP
jgi:hypothetical protein